MIDRGPNVTEEMAFAMNVLFSPVLPPSHLYGGKCKCYAERLKRNTVYFMTFFKGGWRFHLSEAELEQVVSGRRKKQCSPADGPGGRRPAAISVCQQEISCLSV